MKRLRAGVFAALFAVFASLPAEAQDVAGNFDFYVLALSWSPTYCTMEGQGDDAQCGVERHGFIVHGLWPQFETGYPEFCPSPMTNRVSEGAIRSIFDIMPSAGLIRYQWRKHGICTGLRQSAYFELTRQAFAKIAIPGGLVGPADDLSLHPAVIEAGFLASNPGMSPRGISVSCKQRRLADVRICLTKDLQFRECREVDEDRCRARQIDVPAVE